MPNGCRESTIAFIKKQIAKEYEKYKDGRKNSYFRWEDFLTEFYDKIGE